MGNSWSYRTENDVQYEYPNRPILRSFWTGTEEERVDDVTAHSGGGATVLYKLIRDSHRPSTPGMTDRARRLVQRLSAGPEGLRLHEIQVPDAPPPFNQAVRYAEPLQLLRSELHEGESWRVGAWVMGNLAVDLTATVVGRREMTVSGILYPDALEVRYSGPVTGSVEIEGEWALIDTGHYERIWWLASGVGLLRESSELEFHGVIAETTPVGGHLTATRELLGTSRSH